MAKLTPQQRIERYRRSEDRRRGFHDQYKAIAADATVTCTALRTTWTGHSGYHVKLTAGQSCEIPRCLVDLFVQQGLVSNP